MIGLLWQNQMIEQRDRSSPDLRRASMAYGLLQRKCACGGSTGLTGECADCRMKKQEVAQRKIAGAHHNFGRIAVSSPKRASTVLEIGSPSDYLEHEADRVADRVMQVTPAADVDSIHHDADAKTVRRTTVSPYSLSEGRIVDENDEETSEEIATEETGTEEVQTKAADGAAETAGPAVSNKVDAAVQRPGDELPAGTRAFMESRFGYDFSHVRIHADTLADEAAASASARAFTRGSNVVFGRGQYSPDSHSGRWLLAHELAHVVQQGSATPRGTPGSSIKGAEATPSLSRHDRSQTLRRVQWKTAKDTGKDSYPWGSGPKGDIYQVETDAGTKIPAWKPHDGKTYWCHGYTFGGSTAAGGPFSIWGKEVRIVLKDDGWQKEDSCVSDKGHILVFAQNNIAHSGIISSVSAPGAIIDEDASMLDSKWGQGSQNRNSWKTNATQYGRYQVFAKQPNYGPCAASGPNEA